MGRKSTGNSLPCLFCGRAFGNSLLLTIHLDVSHENWVDFVMQRLGLAIPPEYPIKEYRQALAEATALQELPVAEN